MTHKISKIPHLEALGLMIMVWVALLVVGVSALGVNIPTSLLSGNGSQINVNNSLYWQGHTGTDGSWLTGIAGGNASWNQTLANTLYAPNTTAGIKSLVNDVYLNLSGTNANQHINIGGNNFTANNITVNKNSAFGENVSVSQLGLFGSFLTKIGNLGTAD